MTSQSELKVNLNEVSKIPMGLEFRIGNVGPQTTAVNKGDEDLLANMVFIFLILVLSGIALSCISFGLREYYISLKHLEFLESNIRIKEDEWDLQDFNLSKTIGGGDGREKGKSSNLDSGNAADDEYDVEVVQIPQTRVISLNFGEVNELKSGNLPKSSNFCENAKIYNYEDPTDDEDINNEIFGKLRIVEDEVISPGFSDASLNKIARKIDGKEQIHKIRYCFFDLLAIRKQLRSGSRDDRFLPVTTFNSLREINEFMDHCSQILFNQYESSTTKLINLVKIISLCKNFGVLFLPKVCACIESFISNMTLLEIHEKCSKNLQFLIVDLVDKFLIDQWSFQKSDKMKKRLLRDQFQMWNLSDPCFVDKVELFQLICKFITEVCGLRHLRLRSKVEIRLISLLRKTAFEIECQQYDSFLPVVSHTIHKLQSKKLKLELYYVINNLIDEHYQCCIADNITSNYNLKAIFQHGLFIKHDSNIRKCAQEMGRLLYSNSKNHLISKWIEEVKNGEVYVSAIGASNISDLLNGSDKSKPQSQINVRHVTPGAWRIDPPETTKKYF